MKHERKYNKETDTWIDYPAVENLTTDSEDTYEEVIKEELK